MLEDASGGFRRSGLRGEQEHFGGPCSEIHARPHKSSIWLLFENMTTSDDGAHDAKGRLYMLHGKKYQYLLACGSKCRTNRAISSPSFP